MTLNPVLVIPGFMGSRLRRVADGQLIWINPVWAAATLNEFLRDVGLQGSADPRLTPDGILHDLNIADLVRVGIYRDLHEFCVNPAGLALRPDDYHEFAYDWRKTLKEAAGDLETTLCRISRPPVTVIAHSQGGLVLSTLFRDHPEGVARIDKIFAIGCPFAGLLKTILMIQQGSGVLTALFPQDPIRNLLLGMPATYELMPAREVPDLFEDESGSPVNPLAHPEWFPPTLYDAELLSAAASSLPSLPNEFAVPLRIIEGYGVDTPVSAEPSIVGPRVKRGISGDGTCPAVSLLWGRGTPRVDEPGTRYLSLPFAEHVELAHRSEFFEFLRSDLVPGLPRRPQITARVRSAMLPAGEENLLIVETRTADGKALRTGRPRVATTGGLSIKLQPCPVANEARWLADFPQPHDPQRIQVQVPGIPAEAQPAPFLISGT